MKYIYWGIAIYLLIALNHALKDLGFYTFLKNKYNEFRKHINREKHTS